jgi:hypothetical protein
MKTTIDNNLRVFQVTTSTGKQFFCNLPDLNTIVSENSLQPGYFKVFHFWNNKPQKCSRKYLQEMHTANGIHMNFHY